MTVYAHKGDTHLLRTCKVLAFPPLWEKLGSLALPRLLSKAKGSVSPMTFQGRQLQAFSVKLNSLGQRDNIVCICTKFEKQTNKQTTRHYVCICAKLDKQTNSYVNMSQNVIQYAFLEQGRLRKFFL